MDTPSSASARYGYIPSPSRKGSAHRRTFHRKKDCRRRTSSRNRHGPRKYSPDWYSGDALPYIDTRRCRSTHSRPSCKIWTHWRAGLIMISVGIRFHQHFAILRGNSIAVNVVFLDLVRDKTLPDPAFRNSLHRIFLFHPSQLNSPTTDILAAFGAQVRKTTPSFPSCSSLWGA